MRCDVLGVSGHVTIKPSALASCVALPPASMQSSICDWGTFYKLGVYAGKVKCLTSGGLHCVEGTTDTGVILCDRRAEDRKMLLHFRHTGHPWPYQQMA